MVNLETKVVDSEKVIITEHSASKDYRRFPELYADTSVTIRESIKSGRTDKIPPIVAFYNPFGSKDKTIEAYKKYKEAVPREGEKSYECEDEVLKQVLEQDTLLCYNGNRRLEEFQKARLPIRAFVICTQEEYNQIPEEERRIPEHLKEERPIQHRIDENFVLSYLRLLDDVIYIQAEKRHWDNFDSKKLLADMKESRKD